MSKFLIQIIFFVTIGILLGEGIVRIFQLSIDVPKMYKDENKLIRYEPNQSGNYINGDHQWVINKYGNYGYEPQSLDTMITVIGDSYISNVMNPPKCHQANFLSSLNSNFNFYPNSRDGASFIEFLEMKRSLNELNPVKHLFYVHHGDFIESIMELKNNPLTVQVSLESNEIRFAKLTSSKLKNVLYNFKLAYYLYRNFLIQNINKNVSTNNRNTKSENINYTAIQELLDFVIKYYQTDNIILVFSPDANQKVVDMTQNKGFEVWRLEAENYEKWQLENDSHWSCEGHKKAAEQVNNYLQNLRL
mgnify:CR=1 FL=1